MDKALSYEVLRLSVMVRSRFRHESEDIRTIVGIGAEMHSKGLIHILETRTRDHLIQLVQMIDSQHDDNHELAVKIFGPCIIANAVRIKKKLNYQAA